MQFDDRLATVLRHKASASGGARTQYRQLLDLLGRPHEGRDPSLVAAARLRLESLADVISVRERAEIIREQGRRLHDPVLVAQFAEAEPDIASATLSTARLTEADWLRLIPELPVRARGFLRLRRDLPDKVDALLERLGVLDRALPLPPHPEPLVEKAPQSDPPPQEAREDDKDIVDGEFTEVDPSEASEPEPVPPYATEYPRVDAAAAVAAAARTADTDKPAGKSARDASGGSGAEPQGEIAALRERIDAFQRAREARQHMPQREEASDAAAPTLPFSDSSTGPQELTGFGFSTDTAGVIDWADSFAAARVVYLSLPSVLPEEYAGAIERQQPLRGVPVVLEGGPAIAGEWVLDAQPRFSSPDGRFLGFAGGMRRALEAEEPGNQSDRLRQLLHELRTPVNAIQGFAEVIQQQVVGPVPHDYRALAAGIAGDSARMLAGFDDLERLSRLESGQLRPKGGDADLAAIFRQHLGQLVPLLQPRNAGFVATLGGTCRVDLSRAEAELLSWRILATLGSAAAPSEKLALTLDHEGSNAQFVADLPASLNGSEDIFAARGKPLSVAISAGPFGPGFALRLARAEARAIGGSLRRENRRLILTLPALTASEPAFTQGDGVPEHAH
ncbi:sensor histidine kinase [Alteriqipengyuania lutimaris]|uniref:histidine kinase n=1 Tax=Alteriqipengyuania lutimaris TaxID=1538146 RepID=A0A395LTE8_9SPHN|nr:histidine kinase dimerization/phospho-acceptor domain-containing protein [Alteriqipengyuania lutimaris]MBB3033142.1 signal transduction histidine kinase [Alteriqipengyuania lutimaris]RDS77800.1 sensor histidine kinase [Alteriqipengyuania lutimaris]